MRYLRKNDKGFSLIELIIVIAIMAILVGILAPSFISYVEKAKKAKIIRAFDEVCHGMEVIWVDPDNNYATQITGSKQLFINYTISGGSQEDKLFEKYALDSLKSIFGDESDKYLGTIFIENGIISGQKWKYLPEGKTKNYYYVYVSNSITETEGLTGPFYDMGWRSPN